MKQIAVITAIFLLIFFPGSTAAKEVEEHIYIVPAGGVDAAASEYIRRNLPDSFPMSVNTAVDPRKNIPDIAYNSSRKQYNADVILNDIMKRAGVDVRNERILALVDVDLYTPESDYVYGLADGARGICIMSLFRLRNEFYGLQPDDKLFLDRAVKVAARTLALSWNLSDCPDKRCVMNGAGSLSDIDKKRVTFCHACRNKLCNRYEKPLIKPNPLGFLKP